MKKLLLITLFSTLSYADSQHSSYSVAIEDAIFQKCGIKVDLVKTSMFTTTNEGIIFNEVTEVKSCPQSGKLVISFKAPTTREDCTPINSQLSYEMELVGNMIQQARACDENDLCSKWVTPGGSVAPCVPN